MTEPTRRKTLPRYQRDKSAFPKFTLRERDREIVRLVFEHRFLDTELIWHLLKKEGDSDADYLTGRDGKARPVSYGFGRKALYKRLQALYHTSYLNRRFPADQPIGRGYDGPRAIYGIGPKSVGILPDIMDVTPQEVRRMVEMNKVGDPFMRHALEIARFRVILELACRRSQERVRLLFWEQGQHLRDTVYGIDEDGGDRRYTVYPDAFFGLEVREKRLANYFLEIDRGTEPIVSTKQRTDIRNKLVGYRFYRKRERISSCYAYSKTPDGAVTGLDILKQEDASGEFDRLRGFSVMFVTNGSVGNDGTVCGRIANMLGALPALGKFYANNSLYWFTAVSMLKLEEPDSMFGNIWILPKAGSGLAGLID
jgi:hypothetical protein